jgi:hypothetical protein
VQIGEHGGCEAHTPGVHELTGAVGDGDHQRAEGAGAPAAAELVADDDDFLGAVERDSLSGVIGCRALSRSRRLLRPLKLAVGVFRYAAVGRTVPGRG